MSESSAEVYQEIEALVAARQTLELATVSGEGQPCASYAPYIYGDTLGFYVFLSDLALHTANIRSNPNVSVMIIEDEVNSPNLFARNRLVLDCTAQLIKRSDAQFSKLIDQYRTRFGVIVDTLVQLADFNMYSLTPDQGVFVKGFGQAFRISGDSMNQIKHITNPARDMNKSPNLRAES